MKDKNVRQIQGEGFRRWLTDEDFDLIIWYKNDDGESPYTNKMTPILVLFLPPLLKSIKPDTKIRPSIVIN